MQTRQREVSKKFKPQSTSKQDLACAVFYIFYISYIKDDVELKETTDLMLINPVLFFSEF